MDNRLKELRLSKGMSQTQLGIKFNLGKTTVSHYENSERDMPTELLLRLAEFFNVSVEYLLGAGTDKTVKTDYPDSVNTTLVINAARNIDFRKFTGAEIEEFIELMKENANQILSRHVAPSFGGNLQVAESRTRKLT